MKSVAIISALTLASAALPAVSQDLYRPGSTLAAQVSPAKPDVFGTVALPVARSRYDARWRRVASFDGAAVPAALRPAALRSGNAQAQAQAVNATLNRQVRYRFDAPRDHWATARETMASLAGDCEDIAIAKMQALLALGVPASDLFMSIGSDTAAGAVHAVLLVRLQDRFWVLDNRTDRLIEPEAFGQFHPILTFSGERTWLHGYRLGTMPAEVRALSIAANTGRLQVGGAGSSPAQGQS
ncbi:MAG: transglutaminase-like cysteine peptidase [Novosphingobium sp.]